LVQIHLYVTMLFFMALIIWSVSAIYTNTPLTVKTTEIIQCPNGLLGLQWPADISIQISNMDYNNVTTTYSALMNGNFHDAVMNAPTQEAQLARQAIANNGINYDPADDRMSNCTHVLITAVLGKKPPQQMNNR
jgi:hypothetical protein